MVSNYRILSVLFLGFSAGIPLALTGLTLSMWISRLDIDIKTIGLFSLVTLPFSFKYLWSSIFDYVPIPYFTRKYGLRRGWLIFVQICLIFVIMALGNTSPLENITLTAAIAFFVAFFSATQDIIIDALRIEILEKEEQGLGATMYAYGYRIAMLVSGAGSLLLADHISWKMVYVIMSLNILVGIAAVLFLKEPTHSDKKLEELRQFKLSLSSIINYLKKATWLHIILILLVSYKILSYIYFITFDESIGYIGNALFFTFIVISFHLKNKSISKSLPEPILDFCSRPKWLHILLFVIFYKIADTLISTLQSKFYVTMGFSNSEIAYITKGIGFIMTLAGLFIGGIIYYRLGTFKSLLISGILQISSNLLFIWVANQQHDLVALSITIAIENFTGAIGNVVIIAYLSGLCNIAYAATQYALLSSLANIGRTIIAAPAGYLVAAIGWKQFFIITAFAGIPGIVLLYLIFKKEPSFIHESS